MFDDVIQYYYIVPLLSMLIVTITFGINNWDITDIEKKLITRFKRLQIELSLILIETIIIGISFAIILNKVMLEPFKDIDDIYQKVFLVCSTMFFVTFPLTLIVHLVLLFVKWLLVPKINHYLILDDPNEKWFLKRTTHKGQILLENKNNDCIFIKEWDNLKFNSSDHTQTKVGKWVFKTAKRTNLLLIGLFLSMIVLLILYFCLFLENKETKDLFNASVTFLSIVFLFIIFIVIYYVKKNKESEDAST